MGRYIFFQKTLTLGWPRIRLMFPKDHLLVVRDCDERRRRQQYDSDDSDSDLDLTKKILGWEQCNLCSCGFIKWLKINLLSRFNLLSKNMWGLKEQDQDGHGNTGWPWTRWRPGLIKLTKLLLLIVGYLKKFILVSKQIQNNTCCQVAPRAVQAKSNRKNWPIISNFRQRHVPWFAHWEFGMFQMFICWFLVQLIEALSIFTTKNPSWRGFVNLSQSFERMGRCKHMPCVTPRGEFFHIGEDRYLTGMAHISA